MTYDYKRLCNELLSYLYQCNWPDGKRFYALAKRAEAALVEPKPPSLKEQALKELKDWTNEKHGPGGEVFLCEGLSVDIIRRALESLPD